MEVKVTYILNEQVNEHEAKYQLKRTAQFANHVGTKLSIDIHIGKERNSNARVSPTILHPNINRNLVGFVSCQMAIV